MVQRSGSESRPRFEQVEMLATVAAQLARVECEGSCRFLSIGQRNDCRGLVPGFVRAQESVEIKHRIGVDHRHTIDDDPTCDSLTHRYSASMNDLRVLPERI